MANTHCNEDFEFDFFSTPTVQNKVVRTEQVQYNPVGSLPKDKRPLICEIIIPSHPHILKDLSSLVLHVKLRLVNLPIDKQLRKRISVVNNALASLWEKVSVHLNNTLVSSQSSYPYVSYLENLMEFDPNTARSKLANGWSLDNGDLTDQNWRQAPPTTVTASGSDPKAAIEVDADVETDVFEVSAIKQQLLHQHEVNTFRAAYRTQKLAAIDKETDATKKVAQKTTFETSDDYILRLEAVSPSNSGSEYYLFET